MKSLKKLFASSFELRMNSKRSPWKLLVPDLVSMLMTFPVLKPVCAVKELVWILKLCTASMLGT